jgi:hypothetical protein
MIPLRLLLFISTGTVALYGAGALSPILPGQHGAPDSPQEKEKMEPAAVLGLAVQRPYLEGEPIELKLVIINSSDHEIEIEEGLPIFREFVSGGRLVFSRDGREEEGKQRSPKGRIWLGEGKSRRIVLAPGEKREVPLFLQRYCPQPTAGKREFHYRIKIESPKVGDEENPRRRIVAEGKLALTIEPRDEEKLQTVYETLLQELESDRWHSRAQEALAVAEDPVAISYLIRACKKYREYAPGVVGYSFFDALARFPNDKQVRKFMADHISAGYDKYYTADALSLLGDWKVELPAADVRRLRKSEDEKVSKAAEKYIQKMKPKYDELKP